MKKRFLVMMAILCVILSSVGYAATPHGVQVMSYNENINYLMLMLKTVEDGSEFALQMGAIYEAQRNLKIDTEEIDCDKTDYFNTYTNAEDIKTAIQNYIITYNGYTEEEVTLLAKIIYAEAGSEWLSDEWKLCVGNILLNRVASPEFANTIAEVIYSPGQYYPKNSSYLKNLVPSERCVGLAKRLLAGERVLPPSVVFQSNYSYLGSGNYLVLNDKYLGTTYFAYSNHPELYE